MALDGDVSGRLRPDRTRKENPGGGVAGVIMVKEIDFRGNEVMRVIPVNGMIYQQTRR
jgi:hypothetical protein